MVKFPEATKRLFRNIFVCRRCKTKIKASPQSIIQKKVACRSCNYKTFRPIKKGK